MSVNQETVIYKFQEHFPFDCTSHDLVYEYLPCGSSEYKIILESTDTNTVEELFLTRCMLANKEILPLDPDSTVLVLNCPSFGLPGVAALQLGYKNTTFVAQNAQMVQDVIWPSVFLNCVEQMSLTRCFSVPAKEKDWLTLAADTVAEASSLQCYAVILIPGFKHEDVEQLLHVLHRHLYSTGVCLVSSSTSCVDTLLSATHCSWTEQMRAAGYQCVLQEQHMKQNSVEEDVQVWKIHTIVE